MFMKKFVFDIDGTICSEEKSQERIFAKPKQKTINFINSLNKELKMEIKTIKANVFTFLKKTKAKYNFIFADTPFDLKFSAYIEIIKIVYSSNILLEDSLLVIEHSKEHNFENIKYFVQSRVYGNNTFSFFKKKAGL